MSVIVLVSALISVSLLVQLAIVLINLTTGPFLNRGKLSGATPSVSLLIPARNEAARLPACFAAVQKLNYPDLEIIILDDHSTDESARLIREFAAGRPHVKILSGAALPNGWLGKNWACHQLAQAATGEYFVFMDADVAPGPESIRQTVGWMRKKSAGVLSAFLQQRTESLAERMVVPLVELFVYALLPLWLAFYSRSPVIAAACGQWIAFSRRAYERLGGHACVRHEIVEDVALARMTKRNGEKLLLTSGRGCVFCRMYTSATEVWEGFSKNAFGLLDHKIPALIAFHGFVFSHYVLPLVLLLHYPQEPVVIVSAMLVIAVRASLAIGFRQPFFSSTLLHIPAVLLGLAISINSFVWARTGRTQWKGRRISIAQKKNLHNEYAHSTPPASHH